MAIADNSKIQTPQPLFGGYAPPTIPGISVLQADVMQQMEAGNQNLNLDITEILKSKSIQGVWVNEFQGRATRPVAQGDVITVGFATGGSGYGDPLERDPELVLQDLLKEVISESAALNIYHVVCDSKRGRVDVAATEERRQQERRARISRGKVYDEFEREWCQKQPSKEILTWYGSWPDAKIMQPIMRP